MSTLFYTIIAEYNNGLYIANKLSVFCHDVLSFFVIRKGRFYMSSAVSEDDSEFFDTRKILFN